MQRFSLAHLATALVVCSLALAGSAARANTTVVFDTITGLPLGSPGALKFSTETPRNYLGQAFNAIDPNYPTFEIAAMDFFIGYVGPTVPVNYLKVVARFQFWNTFNATAPAGTDVFANAAGPVLDFDLGAQSFIDTPRARAINVTLPTPLQLTDRDLNGIGMTLLVDTGSGLTTTQDLVFALRGGNIPGSGGTPSPGFAVGTVSMNSPEYGYFRNASNRTDFNFNAGPAPTGDGRNIGVNSAVAIRLYATTIPEPSTALLALPALGLLGTVLIRRRRAS